MYGSIVLISVVGAFLFIGGGVGERPFSTIEPSGTAVANGDVKPFQYRTRYVPGRVYDRIYTIFLENTNYQPALMDESLKMLQKREITLTNYSALTHPSQPNYLGSVAGDYFGLASERFVRVLDNVESIVDILGERGISWVNMRKACHIPVIKGSLILKPTTMIMLGNTIHCCYWTVLQRTKLVFQC